jgi:hypothetical protein
MTIPSSRRTERLVSALSTMTSQDDIMLDATWSNDDVQEIGMHIRGKGDRITLNAENFALGTSISDIVSVMAPDPAQCLISSRILSVDNSVKAELVFGSRSAAEAVVNKFNNKMVRKNANRSQCFFDQLILRRMETCYESISSRLQVLRSN